MEATVLRLQYTKIGNMKFISHLDINRLFLRALRRAGLRPRYSEGFHPHPRLSFALPLSLGHESMCELADIALVDQVAPETVLEKLNAVLPDGFRILACKEAGEPFKTAASADYTLTVSVLDPKAFDWIRNTLTGEVMVERKTKSKTERCDISPLIENIAFEEGDSCMYIKARLSVAPNAYLNPNCLWDALQEHPELAPLLRDFGVMRQAIYHKNGQHLSPMA